MTGPASDTFDVIVIGAGPAGENAAQYAIQGSDRTAVLVEQELVGGECSYWACMPSKALLRPWEVLSAARDLPGTASIVGDHSLDVPAMLARRDEITHSLDDSSQVKWAESTGIDVVRGAGRLTGPREVSVTAADGSERTLIARQAVVLATGTTATVPPIDGLRDALPWTSRDVTNLHQVPRRIAVIGGGVVACESATWLRAMGAEVTIVGSAPGLLARNEPFAGELLADRMREVGIGLELGVSVDRVSRVAPSATGAGQVHGGEVTVHFGDGQSVVVDEVLVAVGRTPATGSLGLESVGLADEVKKNRGYVPVDDHLAVEGVDGDWLYAVGDVNGRALLTHMGKYQARIAGAVIAARAEGRSLDGPWYADRADHDMVPQVTFTDPQVASVGSSEGEARSRGIDVEAVEYDLANVSGSYVQRSHPSGHVKMVIDKTADVLVGATFVGPEVADMVHAATIAVVGKVPLSVLWHAVPSYPTPSEVWLRLLETRYNPS